MAAETTALSQLVEVLVDLDVVDFNQPGPWPGPPGEDDQVCDVDLTRVWADHAERSESVAESFVTEEGGWASVMERVQRARGRGPWTPPPILDALAWYVPVHYFGEDSAIYIREDALLDIVVAMAGYMDPELLDQLDILQSLVSSAFTVLFLHEMFHHKTESFAIRAEVIEQRRLYVPYSEMVTRLLAHGSDEVLEEAIACAQMVNRLGEPRYSRGVHAAVKVARKRFLSEWIPTLGPSYRRGLQFVTKQAHDRGLRSLYGHVHETTLASRRNPIHWTATPNINRGLFDVQSVTKVVVPVGAEPLIPWFTPAFRGTLLDRAAIRVLTRHFGCTQVSGGGKGSHTKLHTPSGQMVIIPKGTQSPKAIRDAALAVGTTGQELVDLGRSL
jgi:hypothetical protein